MAERDFILEAAGYISRYTTCDHDSDWQPCVHAWAKAHLMEGQTEQARAVTPQDEIRLETSPALGDYPAVSGQLEGPTGRAAYDETSAAAYWMRRAGEAEAKLAQAVAGQSQDGGLAERIVRALFPEYADFPSHAGHVRSAVRKVERVLAARAAVSEGEGK